MSRRRVVIFTGPLFSGNRELLTGGMGREEGERVVLIFREEARRGSFLKNRSSIFQAIVQLFFFCNYKEKE